MGYISQARQRARRKKSTWNLLLLPAVLIPLAIIWVGAVLLATVLHTSIYAGQTLNSATGIGPILTMIAPFFGAMPLAMLLGNTLVRLLPSARHALDMEAEAFPSTSFAASQTGLRRFAAYAVPVAVCICVFGAVLRW